MSVESEGQEVTEDPNKFSVEFTDREEALLRGEDPDDASVGELEEEEEAEEADDDEEADDKEVASDPEPEDKDEEKSESWVGDSDRLLAETYGLSDDELSQIASREELVRTVAILAKQQAKSGKAPAAPADKDEDAEEEVDVDNPVDSKGRVNVAYYKANDYDEGYVKAMEALRASQDRAEANEQYLESLKQQQLQSERDRFINDFMDAADELRPEFYGKSLNSKGEPVTLTNEQAERRQKLFAACEQVQMFIANQAAASGRPAPKLGFKEIVKRAESLAHPEVVSKQRVDAVKAQSQRRRPVAAAAGASSSKRSKSESDDPAVIANDPDVMAAWERAQAGS